MFPKEIKTKTETKNQTNKKKYITKTKETSEYILIPAFWNSFTKLLCIVNYYPDRVSKHLQWIINIQMHWFASSGRALKYKWMPFMMEARQLAVKKNYQRIATKQTCSSQEWIRNSTADHTRNVMRNTGLSETGIFWSYNTTGSSASIASRLPEVAFTPSLRLKTSMSW